MGVASAWTIKKKAAVRIGIHLNMHGIRRDGGFQVIDMVRREALSANGQRRRRAARAMLRSDGLRRSTRLGLSQLIESVPRSSRKCSLNCALKTTLSSITRLLCLAQG